MWRDRDQGPHVEGRGPPGPQIYPVNTAFVEQLYVL